MEMEPTQKQAFTYVGAKVSNTIIRAVTVTTSPPPPAESSRMKPWLSIMGAAALSLVTAVISPLLVQQYQQREANSSQVIKVLQGGALVLSPSVAKAAVPLSNGGDKVARTVFMTNSGSEDICNTVIEIVGPEGDPITDTGDLVGLASAKRPDLQLRDGRIILKFDLLKKEEMVALWVAGSKVGDVEVRAKVRGLRIENIDRYYKDLDWINYLWTFLGIILGIFIGSFLEGRVNRHILKSIGFDPKEVRDSYLESQRDKK